MDMYLTDEGSDPNDVINRVGKEPNEDIALTVDLASVDLIEQRHHDEWVEDHGEMNRGWRLNIRPFTIIEIEDYIPWMEIIDYHSMIDESQVKLTVKHHPKGNGKLVYSLA